MDASPAASDVDPGVGADSRLRSLVEAGILLAEDLSPDGVLQRIVETAAALTGARYAALGVLDPSGTHLERFLTTGVDEATRKLIGGEPRGRGVLGLLIRDARPLRLADIPAHPQAVGFPPGHPPMTSFLGVPVLIRGVPFGNLYLTDKRDGAEFTEGDEELVVLLARQAAVAVANARMFHATRTWARQLEAIGELTDTLLADARGDRLAAQIVRQFRSLVDGDAAAMGIWDVDGRYRIAAAEGKGAAYMLSEHPQVPPRMLRTLELGASVRVDSLADHPDVDPDFLRGAGISSALLVPMMSGERLVGLLTAADAAGGIRFSDAQQRVAEVFAARAAAILELSRRVSRESLRAILDAQEKERRRIGRELHDQVGQELTAALLALKLIGADVTSGDTETALHEIAALREMISDSLRGVRALSSMLTPPALADHSLRAALERLAGVLQDRSGVVIEVRDELGDLEVPEPLRAELYRIAQGGLTNVVRHAGARRALVRVEQADGRIGLHIEDDGMGIDPDVPFGVGLEGANERMKLLGGSLSVGLRPGGGTILSATIPLR